MPTTKALNGNVRVEEEYSVVSYLDSLKLLKKSAELRATKAKQNLKHHILSKVMCQDAENYNLDSDNLINEPSSLQCVVYHLCGFLVHKAKGFTDCVKCLSSLEDPNPTGILSSLTEIKDLGGLRYPSVYFFD